jgi:HEAT repeat protein
VLQAAIAHPDSEVVKEAVMAAGLLPEGVSLALSVLGHSHWDVRAAAARVLAGSADPSCVESLRQALAAEHDPMARAAMSEALRRVGNG